MRASNSYTTALTLDELINKTLLIIETVKSMEMNVFRMQNLTICVKFHKLVDAS